MGIFHRAARLFDQGDVEAAYTLYGEAGKLFGHRAVAYDLRRCEMALGALASRQKKKLHAFVISWEGQQHNAAAIATLIKSNVDELTVIYSNKHNTVDHGEGDWHRVDNSEYFGGKFRRALELFKGDIFLLVHADAESSGWANLLSRCRLIMADETVGIWAPDVDYTPWDTNRVKLADVIVSGLSQVAVAQTDGIVVAFSKRVIDRLRLLNYASNNLGWGIDWAAICYCYAQRLLVVRDPKITVVHPKGHGYSSQQALSQMTDFLMQLTLFEQLMYILLNKYIGTSTNSVW